MEPENADFSQVYFERNIFVELCGHMMVFEAWSMELIHVINSMTSNYGLDGMENTRCDMSFASICIAVKYFINANTVYPMNDMYSVNDLYSMNDLYSINDMYSMDDIYSVECSIECAALYCLECREECVCSV